MSLGGMWEDEFELFDALIFLALFLQALGDVMMVEVVFPERRGGRLRREAFGCAEGVMVLVGLDVALQLL